MAAFGGLQSLFEKPLPENPTLMESLSWNQINSVKPPHDAAVTEIFGELHFKERRPTADADQLPFSSAVKNPASHPAPSASPWSHALDRSAALGGKRENLRKNGEDPLMGSSPGGPGSGAGSCFPLLDSLLGATGGKGANFAKGHAESLQLCTEGLGFESSDDVEDSRAESGKTAAAAGGAHGKWQAEGCNGCPRACSEAQARGRVEFPPPISCIGSGGKPWVQFRSYREGGRFVLREVRLPSQELLHAFRKDGRLKLHFVQSDEEIEQEEEDVDEEEDGGEEGGEAEVREEEGPEVAGEGVEVKKGEFGGVD